MKIFISLVLMFVSFVGIAQKNIPAATKAAFAKAFNNVTDIKWEKEEKNYEVSFMQSGNKMSAVIDEKGKVLETETELKVSSLMPQIISYMKVNFKGKELVGAAKIIYADGSLNYEAAIKGKDILFDSNGKFLKVAKD